MSRLNLAKVATPSSPAAGTGELFFSSTLVPAGLAFIDESGNITRVGGLTTQDYRLIRVAILTAASGTFTPTSGARALYVEGVGAGGGGGGVLDAATNSAGGGGGGSGAYAAAWLTSIAASYAYACPAGGAGGSAGANNGTAGADATFGTAGAQLTCDGGSGGISDTVSTVPKVGGLGGAGGLAANCTGDLKSDGSPGENGMDLTAASAVSGRGGSSYFGGGANGRSTQGDGTAAAGYGGGGAGGLDLSSAASQAGGNGGPAVIRVWEFA